MKTLKLTLTKKPFEVMLSGEKQEEFRVPSQWIESRLLEWVGPKLNKVKQLRQYDFVEFTNGYGENRPRFVCEFKIAMRGKFVKRAYTNGLVVEAGDYWVINLGDILAIKNCQEFGRENIDLLHYYESVKESEFTDMPF